MDVEIRTESCKTPRVRLVHRSTCCSVQSQGWSSSYALGYLVAKAKENMGMECTLSQGLKES